MGMRVGVRLFGLFVFFVVFDHLFDLGPATGGLAVARADAYGAPESLEGKASAPNGFHDFPRRDSAADAHLAYALN